MSPSFCMLVLVLWFFFEGLCVNPEGAHEEINGKCNDKPDGEYPVRNVMQFVICKGGRSELLDCPNNTLYGQGERSCVSADGVTIERFCEERINGAWKNPWNCHGFIQCLMGESEERECTIKGEVYDPKRNDCTPKAACVELPKKLGADSQLPVPPVVIADKEDQKAYSESKDKEPKPKPKPGDKVSGEAENRQDVDKDKINAFSKDGEDKETHWYEEMRANDNEKPETTKMPGNGTSGSNNTKEERLSQAEDSPVIGFLRPGEISVTEVASMLKTGNIKLIDVRNPWELKSDGKIGASANIPLSEIESAFRLPSDEFESKYRIKKPEEDDCQIVLHCRSGVRSMKALYILRSMRYTCAKSMAGGFEAWKSIYS